MTDQSFVIRLPPDVVQFVRNLQHQQGVRTRTGWDTLPPTMSEVVEAALRSYGASIDARRHQS